VSLAGISTVVYNFWFLAGCIACVLALCDSIFIWECVDTARQPVFPKKTDKPRPLAGIRHRFIGIPEVPLQRAQAFFLEQLQGKR
jgi:hypothetical protein